MELRRTLRNPDRAPRPGSLASLLQLGIARQAILFVLGSAVLAAFAHNVSQHFFLGDDAYISFRYARNLVDGLGLVWNAGEPVEGYTNFLWVLLMAVGMLVGIDPVVLSTALGIISGLTLLGALLAFGARSRGWLDPWIWLPVAALALSRSFTAWCSGGLETMFFTLLVFLAFATFVAERRRGGPAFGSAILFALAALTRPEGILFAGIAGLFLASDWLAGRRSLRHVLNWASPLVAIVGAHFLWRYGYYGFWLPNTFYAKVAGLWWQQAFAYLSLFVRDYYLYAFVPLAFLSWLPLGRQRHEASGIFAAILVVYGLYLIYVGGDRFEYRFLVVVFPYFYWSIAECLRRLAELGQGQSKLVFRALAFAAAGALLATTVLGGEDMPPASERRRIASIDEIRNYATGRAAQGKLLRKYIDEGTLPADLVLGLGGAGAVPYYTGWTTVDRRGLNDVEIAHTPLDRRKVIAHEHDASYEYLERRKVVVFDKFNSLIHTDFTPFRGKRFTFHDRTLRVRAIELDGVYLVFGTFVPDRQLDRIFSPRRVLR